jgi:hypothetical protein
LHVFDQDKNCWLTWTGEEWQKRSSANPPLITRVHFTGTGTRTLNTNGQRAIESLFSRSFRA